VLCLGGRGQFAVFSSIHTYALYFDWRCGTPVTWPCLRGMFIKHDFCVALYRTTASD
jgi:hypothetical protein